MPLNIVVLSKTASLGSPGDSLGAYIGPMQISGIYMLFSKESS